MITIIIKTKVNFTNKYKCSSHLLQRLLLVNEIQDISKFDMQMGLDCYAMIILLFRSKQWTFYYHPDYDSTFHIIHPWLFVEARAQSFRAKML